MPITKRDSGWYWGSQGPFDSRKKAQEVAQAAHASGYQKAWMTNPRGDGKNVKGEQKYTESNKKHYDTASEFIQKVVSQGIPFDTINPANDGKRKKVLDNKSDSSFPVKETKPKSPHSNSATPSIKQPVVNIKRELKKEGDGGGDGGSFGGGAGTVFSSENAGIFTPTHSERGRKPKRKKVTGLDRLNDFITERSPERKMQKSIGEQLIEWVRQDLNKEEEPKNPVEFDAKPDKKAAQEQLAEEARIKQLDDSNTDDANPSTAQASETAPAGLNVQLGWDAGGSQNDSLHAGGSQDTLYDEEDDNRVDRELKKQYSPFLQKLLDDLDK